MVRFYLMILAQFLAGYAKLLVYVYRVTHHVVPLVRLTWKQKFRFSICYLY